VADLRNVLWAIALIAAACGDDDDDDAIAPCESPTWQTLVDDSDEDDADLGAAVLGVWGTSARDVWFSGGTIGVAPERALALHFDGERWQTIDLGVSETLWWVTQTPEGTVWFAGERGRIVRWDGAATSYDVGIPTTLFGIWGCADDDVWAVGGDVSGDIKDVIVHFDGDEWTQVPAPGSFDVQFLKIWGAACDAVWLVGAGGTILRWDGEAWSQQESGVTTALFGISGRGRDDVWAVGASSVVLHHDGTAWAPFESVDGPLFGGLLQGASAAIGGDVFVVGIGGVKLALEPDGGHLLESLTGTTDDLHGIWADAEGLAFAVGGDYSDPAGDLELRPGTIAYRGCDISVEGLP
jgi:hypothetical protein